jgi:hypothetical protein
LRSTRPAGQRLLAFDVAMKMKTIVTACVLILLTLSFAWAEGSVDWEFHAMPILRQHPELLSIIERALDVAKTGSGTRMGKDFGQQQGKRIPPYEFRSRPKGSSGDFNLILIIHDPSGMHQDNDNQTWIEIRPKK